MAETKIRAEFVRDKKGRLVGIKEIDIIHYCIRLYIENPPVAAEKVVYQLHESYGNPRLEVKAGVANFAEEITSYGDYDVKAKIYHNNQVDSLMVLLSQALAETYGESPAAEVQTALEQIRRL
jgi:transcription initiation factor IIF auxiliary subunit